MYYSDLQYTRRLLLHLQEAALTAMASSPLSSQDNNGDSSSNSQFDPNSFSANTRFSPSMAIILVVLLSAFFFLAFFSIYMRRCTHGEENRPHAPTATPVAAAQPQGVSPAFLQSLPLVAFSSSKKKGTIMECVVCLTDFEENEPLKQLPRCKHVFHQDCIDMWLFSHTTCPLCRRSVMSDGSRSFRWGGSGSSRLSSLRRASSIAGHIPDTEGDNGPQRQGENMVGNSNGDEGADARQPLPRSHSTGHSSLKWAFSRAPFWSRTNTPLSDLQGRGDVEEEEEESGSGAGCLSVAPSVQAFQRSRSVAASGVNGWNVGVATLKRGLSSRKTEMAVATPVGLAAASSSARSTFDRVNAAV